MLPIGQNASHHLSASPLHESAMPGRHNRSFGIQGAARLMCFLSGPMQVKQAVLLSATEAAEMILRYPCITAPQSATAMAAHITACGSAATPALYQ